MKILYDYKIFKIQKFGGISRYYCELIKYLKKLPNVYPFVHCFFSINEYYSEDNKQKKYTNNHIYKIFSPLINIINIIYTKIIDKKFDIIHSTYYSPYIYNSKKKMVITVYDMIHELYEYNGKYDYKTISNKKKAIFKSDHIIAISQNTKNDILKIYPEIPENKISVIYIGSNFRKKIISDEKIISLFPNKYILYVGNREWYKNFDNFYYAIERLLKEDNELFLVCVGGPFFNNCELSMFDSYVDRVLHIVPNDDILSYAYTNALCFVFPSKYEGFGIPILEAFACDCPIAISNSSSFPEVAKDAALYFNPNDIDDIYNNIKNIIYNNDMRDELIIKGKKQLENFSWDIIAKQVAECYENLLKKDK